MEFEWPSGKRTRLGSNMGTAKIINSSQRLGPCPLFGYSNDVTYICSDLFKQASSGAKNPSGSRFKY